MAKLSPRSAALAGLLVVAAIAVRGSIGGLLGIVALLVLLDAVIPMPGVTWPDAEDRFARLVRAMPPISVYRVGDRHVVLDGHHRVSVARERGLTVIDAEVVELLDQCVSSRSPAGPSSRARGTRPPAPHSAHATTTGVPSRAPAPRPHRR
jgi:hypothetical protein